MKESIFVEAGAASSMCNRSCKTKNVNGKIIISIKNINGWDQIQDSKVVSNFRNSTQKNKKTQINKSNPTEIDAIAGDEDESSSMLWIKSSDSF